MAEKKQKKVGIRYYLNTRKKPYVHDGKEYYPVICQVTFLRKNTQFYPLIRATNSRFTKDEFEKHFIERSDIKQSTLIKEFEVQLEAIVRFEYKMLGDVFSMSGISDRYIRYMDGLIPTLENILINKLKKEISSFPFKNVEAQEMKTLLHSIDGFLSVAYSILKNRFPVVHSMLNDSLKIEISALNALKLVDFDLEENEIIKVIDFLLSDAKNEFQRAVLMEQINVNEYLRYESKNSPSRLVFNDFPVKKEDLPKYLYAIDMLIANNLD